MRSEIKRLREMTGLLEVRAPDGAMVHSDTVARGKAPIVGHIPEAAGVIHVVTVTLENEDVQTQEVVVTGGKKLVVDFTETTQFPSNGSSLPPKGISNEKVGAIDIGFVRRHFHCRGDDRNHYRR